MLTQLRQLLVAFLLLSLFNPSDSMGFARAISLEVKMWRRRRKTCTAPPNGGAYRDSYEAAQARINELELQLSSAKAGSDLRDELITMLFKGKLREFFLRPLQRLRAFLPKPSAAGLGGSLAVLSTCAILLGVCNAARPVTAASLPRPHYNGHHTHVGPPFVIRVQVTTGGEVTQDEMQVELWEWRCALTERWECHLVPGSPYLLAAWAKPAPICQMQVWEEGDRPWQLWVFPERRGPATLTYIRN